MRYWIKFTKEGLHKYISHRDILKVMTRTIKRAGLPIAFSQGFNPHALLSFSSPLELGVASVTEFMDIHLTEELSIEELTKSLQLNLPEGFKTILGMKVPKSAPKLMAWIELGVYKIESSMFTKGLLNKVIGNIEKQDEINIVKLSKKKAKRVNAKVLIKQLKQVEGDVLQVTLQTGQKGNLKVSQFIEIVERALDRKIEEWQATRVKLLGLSKGVLVSPEELIKQNY